MKKILFIFALLINICCFAQLSKEQIRGTWLVENVSLDSTKFPNNFNNSAEMNAKIKIFREALLNGKLIFSNSNFEFKLAQKQKGFMVEFVEMMSNLPWKINSEKQIIEVGEGIAFFKIFDRKKETFILIDESPFLLKVRRL